MAEHLEKHYAPKELARLLGITIPLLTYLRRTGRGPKYIKFGLRSIIYSETEVRKFLNEQERLSTSDTGRRKDKGHGDKIETCVAPLDKIKSPHNQNEKDTHNVS